jgi:hypothetical protein
MYYVGTQVGMKRYREALKAVDENIDGAIFNLILPIPLESVKICEITAFLWPADRLASPFRDHTNAEQVHQVDR